MRVGLKVAFFRLRIGSEFMLNCLVHALVSKHWKPKPPVQYSVVPMWAVPDTDGMHHHPPAKGRTCPGETGGELRRCWEQKEAAGRCLSIQRHEAVRSMLWDAVPFLFPYPAWRLGLVCTTRSISTGKVLKCSALGAAASSPLALRSLWPPARAGTHSRHVLTIIQQSKHPARHRAWLLFVGILTYFC